MVESSRSSPLKRCCTCSSSAINASSTARSRCGPTALGFIKTAIAKVRLDMEGIHAEHPILREMADAIVCAVCDMDDGSGAFISWRPGRYATNIPSNSPRDIRL